MDPISVIVVFVITEITKHLADLEGGWVNATAVGVGVALAVANALIAGTPPDASIVSGVMLGLTTTGSYELVRRITRAIQVP